MPVIRRTRFETNVGEATGNAANCTPLVSQNNIRFWDIGLPTCKQCLVSIEATTEDQNLYPGVQTLFEAAENGTGGSSLDPDPSRQISIQTPIFHLEI